MSTESIGKIIGATAAGKAEIALSGLSPVVINLRSRPDRLSEVAHRLSTVGAASFHRFSAQSGSDLSIQSIRSLLGRRKVDFDAPRTSHLKPTRAAIGCSVSHLRLWNILIESSGRDSLVILEDDVIPFREYLSADWLSIVHSPYPQDADIVLLGCNVMGDMISDSTTISATGCQFKRVYYFNGTYAYFIRKEGCRKLLPYLLPIRAHLDHQISQALVANESYIRAYAASPPWFGHDYSSPSDITGNFLDESAADSEFEQIIRRAREQLLLKGVVL